MIGKVRSPVSTAPSFFTQTRILHDAPLSAATLVSCQSISETLEMAGVFEFAVD